ncbi:unnamed protein product [Prunus armeniaca]
MEQSGEQTAQTSKLLYLHRCEISCAGNYDLFSKKTLLKNMLQMLQQKSRLSLLSEMESSHSNTRNASNPPNTNRYTQNTTSTPSHKEGLLLIIKSTHHHLHLSSPFVGLQFGEKFTVTEPQPPLSNTMRQLRRGTKLQELEMTVDEDMMVHCALNSLPKDFKSLRETYIAQKEC